MQITKWAKSRIAHKIIFSMVVGASLVVCGCDKIGNLENFQFPTMDRESLQSKWEPRPIVSMESTLKKLKSKNVVEQEEALQEIQHWLNDGVFNAKDIKAMQALLDYIANPTVPLFLRGKAVGMLMSSTDDKTTGEAAQKALEKQLDDSKKGEATAEAMVECLDRSDVSESHKKKIYALCSKSEKGWEFLVKVLLGSDKDHSQIVKQLMEENENSLSPEKQGVIGEQLLEMVENPDWKPDVSYFKEVILFLKTKLAFEKYVEFILYLAWSSDKEIRNLLATDAFTKKDGLHKHTKLIIEALNKASIGSLAAKAIVQMLYNLEDLLLIGNVLINPDAQKRVHKTGIDVVRFLVALINELMGRLKASLSYKKDTPNGIILPHGFDWDIDVDANCEDQVEATLIKHKSHLRIEKLKNAFTDQLRELTHIPVAEGIEYTYTDRVNAIYAHMPLPVGVVIPVAPPPYPLILNRGNPNERRLLIAIHQRKFLLIVNILRRLNNMQLNQHLQDQAGYIRRGRAVGEGVALHWGYGWGLP